MTSSRRNRGSTARKRSSGFALHVHPIQLDPDFPLDWYHYRHPAREITWLHRHDCLELGYCHAGSGIFVIEDKVVPYAAGDSCIVSEHEMHLATSAPGSTSNWTFLSLDAALLLPTAEPRLVATRHLTGPDFRNLVPAGEDPLLASLLRELIDELEATRPGYRDAARALVWRLMIHLHRHHAVARPSPGSGTLDPLAPALATIGQRYAEPLDIPQLAAACGLSESHFRRLFTARVGSGPKAYLNHLRVQMACSLLRDPRRSVLEIALEVGFGSVSAFNRQFQAVTGSNPRSWRQQQL